MACSSPATSPAGCASVDPPVAAPPLAEDVLYQWVGIDAEGATSGLRVRADGRVERQRRGHDWEALATVSSEALAPLRAAVAVVHDGAWARPVPVDGGSAQWVQVRRDDGVHRLYLGPGCEVDELKPLFEAAAGVAAAARPPAAGRP